MCVVRRNTAELDVWHLKAYVSWKTEVYGVHVVRGTSILLVHYLLIPESQGFTVPPPPTSPRDIGWSVSCVFSEVDLFFFFRYLYIYYWVAYILKDLLKTNFCSVHHTADHSNIQKNYYDQIISIHCYYQVFSGL